MSGERMVAKLAECSVEKKGKLMVAMLAEQMEQRLAAMLVVHSAVASAGMMVANSAL